MTSLWNRIKSTKKDQLTSQLASAPSTNKVDTTTNEEDIATPWTISRNSSTSKSGPITDFWIRTPLFRVSSQKLNMLGRQISRLPLPMAILQMKFTPKKAGNEVYDLLMQAQARITKLPEIPDQVIDPSKFIVQQATVGNGPYLKRIDIKGRGRHGVIWRPHSFMRIQVALPDEDAILKKRFRVRIQKENKPAMLRLNY